MVFRQQFKRDWEIDYEKDIIGATITEQTGYMTLKQTMRQFQEAGLINDIEFLKKAYDGYYDEHEQSSRINRYTDLLELLTQARRPVEAFRRKKAEGQNVEQDAQRNAGSGVGKETPTQADTKSAHE